MRRQGWADSVLQCSENSYVRAWGTVREAKPQTRLAWASGAHSVINPALIIFFFCEGIDTLLWCSYLVRTRLPVKPKKEYTIEKEILLWEFTSINITETRIICHVYGEKKSLRYRLSSISLYMFIITQWSIKISRGETWDPLPWDSVCRKDPEIYSKT